MFLAEDCTRYYCTNSTAPTLLHQLLRSTQIPLLSIHTMKCEAAHALKLDKKAQLNISCPKHSQAFSLSDEVAEKEAAIHRQAMDMQVRNGYGIWLCTELCPFEGTASSITLYTFTSTPPLFLTSSEPLAAVQHVSTRSRAWPLHAGSALRWRSRRTCTYSRLPARPWWPRQATWRPGQRQQKHKTQSCLTLLRCGALPKFALLLCFD